MMNSNFEEYAYIKQCIERKEQELRNIEKTRTIKQKELFDLLSIKDDIIKDLVSNNITNGKTKL